LGGDFKWGGTTYRRVNERQNGKTYAAGGDRIVFNKCAFSSPSASIGHKKERDTRFSAWETGGSSCHLWRVMKQVTLASLRAKEGGKKTKKITGAGGTVKLYPNPADSKARPVKEGSKTGGWKRHTGYRATRSRRRNKQGKGGP